MSGPPRAPLGRGCAGRGGDCSWGLVTASVTNPASTTVAAAGTSANSSRGPARAGFALLLDVEDGLQVVAEA